jgi:hypothetical protein
MVRDNSLCYSSLFNTHKNQSETHNSNIHIGNYSLTFSKVEKLKVQSALLRI